MTKCLSALLIIFALLITSATLQAEDKAANKGKKAVDYRANLAQVPAAFNGTTDTWTWQDAKSPNKITRLSGTRVGKSKIALTKNDLAPVESERK